MKIVTVADKRRNAYHAWKSFQHGIHWRRWRRAKNGSTAHYRVIIADDFGHVRGRASSPGIKCPAVFCLDENADEVIEFLAGVRKRLLEVSRTSIIQQKAKRKTHRHVSRYTDFSTIKKITPAAALVLAAEYDRFRRITGTRLPAINRHKWNVEVDRRLGELGFLSLLETDRRAIAPAQAGVHIACFRSGAANLPQDAGQMTEALTTLLREADIDPDAIEHQLYTGLLEAMENARQHAYPGDAAHDDQTVPLWWMTGEVDVLERRVAIAVYDHGVSIPVTLPTWALFDRVQRFFRPVLGRSPTVGEVEHDGRMIRAALSVGRTSTGLQHRGKGLGRLREIVNQARAGRLKVTSRCGEVWYQKGSRVRDRTRRHSIGGTLIELELQL